MISGDVDIAQDITTDKDFTTAYKSNAADCYIDIFFGSDMDSASSLSAEVSLIKYVPNIDLTLSDFVGIKIQGKEQGSDTFEDLYTLDRLDLVNGYNSYYLTEAQKAKFWTQLRFQSDNADNKCSLSEINIDGRLFYTSATATLDLTACPVYATFGGVSQDPWADKVSYKQAITPTISSVSPDKGTTAGGDSITITGTGFSVTAEEVTVQLDDVECVVSSATLTEIVCESGARNMFVKPKLEVFINGNLAAT